jgi:hypothetical protein
VPSPSMWSLTVVIALPKWLLISKNLSPRRVGA